MITGNVGAVDEAERWIRFDGQGRWFVKATGIEIALKNSAGHYKTA